MVSKKWIQAYVTKRRERVLKNFGDICLSPDPEAVHDLRVEAKKIKAIAPLLAPAEDRNFLKPIKPLIRKTATIREAELHLQTLLEYELADQRLQQELEANIQNSYGLIHAGQKQYKRAIKTVLKRFDRAAGPLKDSAVENYSAFMVDQLTWHFLWPLDKEQLHLARAKAKSLMYTIRMLPDKLQKKSNLNLSYLDQVQEQIGLWHDLNLTLALLVQKQLTKEPAFKKISEKEAGLFEEVKNAVHYFDKKVMTVHSIFYANK